MSKLMRTAYNSDGSSYQEVAIIVSGGYGSGFSTWSSGRDLEKNKNLAEAVVFGEEAAFFERLKKINDIDACCITFSDLYVSWIPEGSAYRIDEYDGMECLVTVDSLKCTA